MREPKDKTPPPVDERNLVDVDDAFKEADIDDKMWLWWQKNRNFLIMLTVGTLLVVAGIESYKLFKRQSLEKMQSRYNNAAAEESSALLMEFSEAYSGKPLGGAALLQVADEKFSEEGYSAAAMQYADAAESLKGTHLYGRAKLGQAVSLHLSGESDRAKPMLEELTNDAGVLLGLRSQAAYYLTLIAMQNDDLETAREWLNRIEQMADADADGLGRDSVWFNLAQQLKERKPKLKEASEETSDDGLLELSAN